MKPERSPHYLSPWTISFAEGGRPATFWRRRLNRIDAVIGSRPKRRRARFGLLVALAAVCLLPTFELSRRVRANDPAPPLPFQRPAPAVPPATDVPAPPATPGATPNLPAPPLGYPATPGATPTLPALPQAYPATPGATPTQPALPKAYPATPGATPTLSAHPQAYPAAAVAAKPDKQTRRLPRRVQVRIGQTADYEFHSDIETAKSLSEDIIEVEVRDKRRISITAKASGTTQIEIAARGRKRLVDVVSVVDASELAKVLAREFKGSIQVTPIVQGVILRGRAADAEAAHRCRELAYDWFAHVVDNIQVDQQTVLLRCQLLEWRGAEPAARVKLLDFVVGKSRRSPQTANPLLTPVGVLPPGTTTGDILRRLRADGNVKMLAEPSLITVSGRPASLHIGGEFPINVPQPKDKSLIEYRPFGVQLKCVPRLLASGRWRLEVETTFSQINHKQSVQVGQATVPSLQTQRTGTAVEMRSGQTAVVFAGDNPSAEKEAADTFRVAMFTLVEVDAASGLAGPAEAAQPARR